MPLGLFRFCRRPQMFGRLSPPDRPRTRNLSSELPGLRVPRRFRALPRRALLPRQPRRAVASGGAHRLPTVQQTAPQVGQSPSELIPYGRGLEVAPDRVVPVERRPLILDEQRLATTRRDAPGNAGHDQHRRKPASPPAPHSGSHTRAITLDHHLSSLRHPWDRSPTAEHSATLPLGSAALGERRETIAPDGSPPPDAAVDTGTSGFRFSPAVESRAARAALKHLAIAFRSACERCPSGSAGRGPDTRPRRPTTPG